MSFTRLPHADEAEWLAQRREHVTATEIARLAASPAEWARVRAEKAKGSSFTGNRVTRWGHERELEIGGYIHQFVDSRLVSNDDLLVLDGTKISATPDMLQANLSDGCEVIGEIKTSGVQLIPDLIPQKYLDQVQVQLMVTGAEACVFACEVREVDGEGFVPGELKTAVILPDLSRQAELKAIAERFLAGEDPMATDSAELESLAIEALDLQMQISEMSEQLTDVKSRIRDSVGEGSFDCGVAKVTITADTKSTRLDTKALQKDHPEITAHYMVASARKGSVRVTAVASEEVAA